LHGKTGGRGENIYCAILIAKYKRVGAIKEVLNARNGIN